MRSIFLGSRTVSLSRSSGETLVVRSTKSFCEARNLFAKHEIFLRSKKYSYSKFIRMFRPPGDQLIQLDRSRSQTCTEPPAPISFFFSHIKSFPIRFLFLFSSFALWATSLFSWTEAGHRPAPSLRLLFLFSFLILNLFPFVSCFYFLLSPYGRPAYSAGPKQVTDLHRASGSTPFQTFF